VTGAVSRTEPQAGFLGLTLDATALLTAVAFVALFLLPLQLLVRDWWQNPDSGHGLLLGPVAAWLAYRQGLTSEAAPRPTLGGVVLAGAVALRIAAGVAAELFTMRISILAAIIGLILYYRGWPQLRRWWLPLLLFALAIPLPALITNSIAFPLQLRASAMGAALLRWRHIPVALSGNIIQLPGHQLFVTEACSGLRSLTALISLGVLAGGLWLDSPLGRLVVVMTAIPIAIALNAVRVFLTGFLVFFVDPALGEGFMHLTEGWVMFLIAFVALGGVTWVMDRLESRGKADPHAA
jgi:exosortase